MDIRRIIWSCLFIGLGFQAFSQGCSDAGACSIAGHLPDVDSSKKVQYFGFVEQSFGLGEKFVLISQSAVGIGIQFPTRTEVFFQMPFIMVFGNLGSTSGIGDGIISVRQQIFKKNKSDLSFIGGGRLRSNYSDFSLDGKPLPMAYQTSLGTYDVIAAALFNSKSWSFYVAYQHPFGRNKNGYLREEGQTNDKLNYYESADLKRGDDLVLRVQKSLDLKNRKSLLFTLMPVFRLQADQIIKNNENVVLDGSKGMTLNVNVTYSKETKNGNVFELLAGFPVIDRGYRADGLTRNFVFLIRYRPVFR